MEDEVIRWYHQLAGHEFEQTLGDSEGQKCLACCSPCCGRGTEQQENTPFLVL